MRTIQNFIINGRTVPGHDANQARLIYNAMPAAARERLPAAPAAAEPAEDVYARRRRGFSAQAEMPAAAPHGDQPEPVAAIYARRRAIFEAAGRSGARPAC